MREQTLAVQRMQDLIAENPERDISMAELAREAMYSPWYAYRLFKSYLGLTPSEYIRRLRLSRSALRLKAGNCLVTDAAFEAGFGSVDGYQRAFYREFGRNPHEYEKNPLPITLFIPYGVKFRELRKEAINVENVRSVFVQLMRKPDRQVIIKRGIKAKDYFPYCEEVGCDVWGLLASMDSLAGEPVCMWLSEQYVKPGTSVYVQGVEAEAGYSGAVPQGFDVIALPEAEYLVFQGEPFREEDYCEAIQAVQSAMEKYDPSVIGYAWDDANPRIQLEPRGERGYIEMRAVIPLSTSGS